MKKDFLVIPANGSVPFFIPQIGSVNDTWHNLMCDLDHKLCFESVPMDTPFDDLIMLVDDCGKLRPHVINDNASSFYVGRKYSDYIAGTAMVCRTGLVCYTSEECDFMEHDLLPLLPDHIAYFQGFIDYVRISLDDYFEEVSHD